MLGTGRLLQPISKASQFSIKVQKILKVRLIRLNSSLQIQKLKTIITLIEPQQRLQNIATTFQYTKSSYRTTANYLRRPLPPIRYNHIHATEPYTPHRWEACDEPLIPHPTRIAWTYRGIPSSSTSLAGDVHRGPRLGPQDKTPSFILVQIHPAIPLGWKSCCKQEDHRQGVYTYRRQGVKGRHIQQLRKL